MKRILVAAFVCLSACSHQTNSSSRTPSSDASDQWALEHLMNSPNPRAAADAYISRLLGMRLRTYRWIREMDETMHRHRGEAVDIFELPVYRKILVSRALVERIEHRVASVYADAFAMSNDRAYQVTNGIRDSLKRSSRDKTQRVLMNDLLAEIKEAVAEKGLPFQSVSSSGQDGGVPVSPLGAMQLAKAAMEVAPEMDRLAKSLPEEDEITEEVAEEMRNTEFERAGGRDPQSALIAPSTAPNGNVNGKNFPVGTFALTFDDGPVPKHTLGVLATLQQFGVKGTFFWIAKNVKNYSDLVKPVQNAGMQVENHSWNHAKLSDPADLARLKTDLNREINDSTELEAAVFGQRPKFFRAPYGAGAFDENIRGMIARQKMIHVGWNIDSQDWGDPNPVTVLARTLEQIKTMKRGVIPFHDRKPNTPGVVRQLLTQVKSKYRWVTIEQIVNELNGVH